MFYGVVRIIVNSSSVSSNPRRIFIPLCSGLAIYHGLPDPEVEGTVIFWTASNSTSLHGVTPQRLESDCNFFTSCCYITCNLVEFYGIFGDVMIDFKWVILWIFQKNINCYSWKNHNLYLITFINIFLQHVSTCVGHYHMIKKPKVDSIFIARLLCW
jgi:hypothetical protein